MNRVQSDAVEDAERSDRCFHYAHPGPVHIFDAGHSRRVQRQGRLQERLEHRVENVAVPLLAADNRNLVDPPGEGDELLHSSRVGAGMRHDVHDIGMPHGVMKVQGGEARRRFRPRTSIDGVR